MNLFNIIKALVTPMIVEYWYGIIILILIGIYKIYKPTIKGYFGEKSVAVFLSRLDKEKYKVLHDVMIKNSEGKTAQIDHIVVSIYGVFVIETKNYKGWIMGDEDSRYWTQVIYKRKEKLYNPILQNKGHVKALEALLTGFEGPYHPIVSFSVNSDLKVKVTSEVVYSVNLLKTIRKYAEEVISKEDVEKITNRILSANMSDKEDRKDHVKGIRERKSLVSNNVCPKCGGELIDRKGKYGMFKGCSNFPRCRFILKH